MTMYVYQKFTDQKKKPRIFMNLYSYWFLLFWFCIAEEREINPNYNPLEDYYNLNKKWIANCMNKIYLNFQG